MYEGIAYLTIKTIALLIHLHSEKAIALPTRHSLSQAIAIRLLL